MQLQIMRNFLQTNVDWLNIYWEWKKFRTHITCNMKALWITNIYHQFLATKPASSNAQYPLSFKTTLIVIYSKWHKPWWGRTKYMSMKKVLNLNICSWNLEALLHSRTGIILNCEKLLWNSLLGGSWISSPAIPTL